VNLPIRTHEFVIVSTCPLHLNKISTSTHFIQHEAKMTSPTSALVSLPSELHLKIFDALDTDPGAAACLGVTCKTFYPLFRARNHITDLFGFTGCRECLEGGLMETRHPGPACKLLYMLLADWMGPEYIWRALSNKFVTIERHRELDWVEAKQRQDRRRRASEYSEKVRAWTSVSRLANSLSR